MLLPYGGSLEYSHGSKDASRKMENARKEPLYVLQTAQRAPAIRFAAFSGVEPSQLDSNVVLELFSLGSFVWWRWYALEGEVQGKL